MKPLRSFVLGVALLTGAVLAAIFAAPALLLAPQVNKIADRYDAVGLDASACRKVRTSPYVTRDGRCLEKPVREIAGKLAQDREAMHEAVPLD
jgi:hypothetical protein